MHLSLTMKTQEFTFHPGPIFTQLLLADEINRSPAKTHAALLEIMQEHRVTVDGESYKLDPPFLVIATQNPVEQEGTYNLPEAQLDRFMMKLIVNYPTEQQEADILKQHSQQLNLGEVFEKMKFKLFPHLPKLTRRSKRMQMSELMVRWLITSTKSFA